MPWGRLCGPPTTAHSSGLCLRRFSCAHFLYKQFDCLSRLIVPNFKKNLFVSKRLLDFHFPSLISFELENHFSGWLSVFLFLRQFMLSYFHDFAASTFAAIFRFTASTTI